MSAITTHVLDTSIGKPAEGVRITLENLIGEDWQQLGEGKTDSDGRLKTLMLGKSLEKGVFRITFWVKEYFGEQPHFYPFVPIIFEIHEPTEHYHVPLLLNPYGYSTYRGS